MTYTTPSNYWINNSALSLSLNAFGNPEYAQCGVAAGAVIMVWVKGVIDFDPNSHAIRHWNLVGSPVAFGTTSAKYVYAAVPRLATFPNQNALIVFPSERIDLYGLNDNGELVASEDYYYISLQGVVSASVDGQGASQMRYITTPIETGKLATDEAYSQAPNESEWYSYSSVSQMTTFLVNLTMAAGKKFISLAADAFTATTATISKLILGGSELEGVANHYSQLGSNKLVVTPLGGREFFLSSWVDTEAAGNVTFDQTIDVFGNVTMRANAVVGGDATISGDASVGSDLSVSGNASVTGNITAANGYAGSSSFADDLLGHGWRIRANGAGTLDSLSLRKFLEVPELRYNRTEVRTGVLWQTFGAGLIEEVTEMSGELQDGTLYDGMIKLKLESGDVGAVAVNDLCMGIWHNETTPSANATTTTDTHDGNFTFAGFMTVYFKIVAMCDAQGGVADPASNNQYFLYQLRETSQSWSGQHHPQTAMSFACYANPTTASRQASCYSTTEYTIMLTGMTDWEYDGDNISVIIGNLNDFTVPAVHLVDGQWVDYYQSLSGYGIAFGKAYMWGTIQQLTRNRYIVQQQLYYMGCTLTQAQVTAAWSAGTLTINDFTTTPVAPTSAAPYVYQVWEYTDNAGDLSYSSPTQIAIYATSAENYTIDPTASVLYFTAMGADRGDSIDCICYMSKGSQARQPYTVTRWEAYLFDSDGAAIARSTIGTNSSEYRNITLGSFTTKKSGRELTEGTSISVFAFMTVEDLQAYHRYIWNGQSTTVVPLAALSIGVIHESADGTTFKVSPETFNIPLDSNGYFDSNAVQPQLQCSLNIGKNAPITQFTSLSIAPYNSMTDGFDTANFVVTPSLGTINMTLDYNEQIQETTTIWNVTAVYNGVTYAGRISVAAITAGQSISGPQGLQGCVIRPMGEWSDTVTYVNESTNTQPSGLRYIDVVQYEVIGVVKYFQRNTYTQGYAAGIVPTNNLYWTEANMFDFIATKTLLSDEAWMEMCSGRRFYVQDENGNVTAGMQSLDSSQSTTVVPQFFAGSSANNASSAPFRVYGDGSVYASKLTASGSFNIYNEETIQPEEEDYTIGWKEQGLLAATTGRSELWLSAAFKYSSEYLDYEQDDYETASSLTMKADRETGSEITMEARDWEHPYEPDYERYFFSLADKSGLLFCQNMIFQDPSRKPHSIGMGAWYNGIYMIDSAPSSPKDYRSLNQNLETYASGRSGVSGVHITPWGIEVFVGNTSKISISTTGIEIMQAGTTSRGVASGSFRTADGKTVIVKNGIIVDII